jgi:hypothetical protein
MSESGKPNPLDVVAQVQMGYDLILLHLFYCLHHKGVLPLTDAAQSIEEIVTELSDKLATPTRTIMTTMVKNLRQISEQGRPPDPSETTPPTRPYLQVIQGGRHTSPTSARASEPGPDVADSLTNLREVRQFVANIVTMDCGKE